MSAEILALDGTIITPALSRAGRIADAMQLLSDCADDIAAVAYGVPHAHVIEDRPARERRFAQLLDMLDGK